MIIEIKKDQALTVEQKQDLRIKIACLENKMLALPQLEIKETHYFSKCVYGREIFIPAGGLVVGKIHKFENLNIISRGDISVLSIEGVKRLRAPNTFVAGPGTKRVIYAHEDTVWTTIHGTNETDVDKIEEEFIAKTYDEVEQITEVDFKRLKEAEWLG